VVKLLGIDIDYQLNFNYHIKNICRKASQRKALVWIFSNLEVLLLLQKCHAKGQKLKLDKMKV
jgi:UDP-N-acetyl-D-mannosaminuronic acid transferase (WecB/TagA/CpsF family)